MQQTKFLILLEAKVPCRNQLRSIYIVRENNFTEYHLFITNQLLLYEHCSQLGCQLIWFGQGSIVASLIFFKLSCPIFNSDDL